MQPSLDHHWPITRTTHAQQYCKQRNVHRGISRPFYACHMCSLLICSHLWREWSPCQCWTCSGVFTWLAMEPNGAVSVGYTKVAFFWSERRDFSLLNRNEQCNVWSPSLSCWCFTSLSYYVIEVLSISFETFLCKLFNITIYSFVANINYIINKSVLKQPWKSKPWNYLHHASSINSIVEHNYGLVIVAPLSIWNVWVLLKS